VQRHRGPRVSCCMIAIQWWVRTGTLEKRAHLFLSCTK
jgi:hypothetical protein